MSDQHTLTVLVVPDDPNAAPAFELANEALTATGTRATVETLAVQDQAQAERLRFVDSPSFHFDGHDQFPVGAPPAIACGVCPTPKGLHGTPTLRDLTVALLNPYP